jgi:hypothetical protein
LLFIQWLFGLAAEDTVQSRTQGALKMKLGVIVTLVVKPTL